MSLVRQVGLLFERTCGSGVVGRKVKKRRAHGVWSLHGEMVGKQPCCSRFLPPVACTLPDCRQGQGQLSAAVAQLEERSSGTDGAETQAGPLSR